MNKTLAIKALTKDGNKPAYLPLIINITKVELYDNPSPPFFEAAVNDKQATLNPDTLDPGSNVTIYMDLPRIVDFQSDFSSISFSSFTLGSGSFDTTTLETIGIKEKENVWLVYDPETHRLVVTMAADHVEDFAGRHSVSFTLFDENSGKSTTASATLEVDIEKTPEVEEKLPVVEVQEEDDGVLVTAEIVSLSQRGRLTVEFNTEMSTEMIDLSWINSTILDMYIVPHKDWHLDYDDFNVSLLNFTWKTISFAGNRITFDLTFNSPPDISPKRIFDNLVWHVKDPVYFTSKSDRKQLSTRTLDVKVERPITDREDQVPLLKDLLFAIILIGGAMGMIFSGGMMTIAGLVNGMQLIIHMPIFDI